LVAASKSNQSPAKGQPSPFTCQERHHNSGGRVLQLGCSTQLL
jgi:hypothetical protein